MKSILQPLPGLHIVEHTPFVDKRGSFSRLFCSEELREYVGSRKVVQVNHSRTHSIGAVRGLHYQRPPHSEMKLVRCIRGSVVDVVVDIRTGSSTFLSSHCETLSQENNLMAVIPEGFAHGFQVIEAPAELIYFHTAAYHPESEAGLLFSDPRLFINWPLPTVDISERDTAHPLVTDSFVGVSV